MLTWKLKDIIPLLEHSEQAKEHTPCYGMEGTDKPGLLFVKDRGVYLMSNGTPHLPNPNNPKSSLVAYAKGHDPEKDDDTWEADREECGGDDFGEFIEAESIRKAINRGKKTMSITMTLETFTITCK